MLTAHCVHPCTSDACVSHSHISNGNVLGCQRLFEFLLEATSLRGPIYDIPEPNKLAPFTASTPTLTHTGAQHCGRVGGHAVRAACAATAHPKAAVHSRYGSQALRSVLQLARHSSTSRLVPRSSVVMHRSRAGTCAVGCTPSRHSSAFCATSCTRQQQRCALSAYHWQTAVCSASVLGNTQPAASAGAFAVVRTAPLNFEAAVRMMEATRVPRAAGHQMTCIYGYDIQSQVQVPCDV
jgi:hypothetical protein